MKKNIEIGSAEFLADLLLVLFQKIRSGEISVKYLEFFLNLSPKKRAEFMGRKILGIVLPEKTSHLSLISEGRDLVVGSPDTSPIDQKVFSKVLFNKNLKNISFDIKQSETENVAVNVYELIMDGNILNICHSFDMDKGVLAFDSEEQIKMFARDHRCWLCLGGATLFLFTKKIRGKEEFLVASVTIGTDNCLNVYIDFFSNAIVWLAEGHHRFIAPNTEILIS